MNEQNQIRDQMDNTRTALSEKLEILEDRVSTSVQDATHDVAQTVGSVTESVQETVADVKETVEDTLTAVRESVDSIKGIFDIPHHVRGHPWFAVGGSVVFGFILGDFLLRSSRRPVRNFNGIQAPRPESLAAEIQAPRPDSLAAAGHLHNGEANGRNGEGASDSANPESLLGQFAPEMADLKSLALGALIGTLRDMVVNAAGDNLGPHLSDIIDSVTKKVGGKPIASRHPCESHSHSAEENCEAP